ncbi:hypothetical protein B0H11DRAFT_1763782, partial [Mycena galericulata]
MQYTPGVEVIQVAISGHIERTGLADAQCSAGIWFSPDDPRNTSIKIPAPMSQTRANAEITATLHCIQNTPPDIPLRITMKGSTVANAINKNLEKWENRGWIGVPDKAPIRSLAGSLRNRRAET